MRAKQNIGFILIAILIPFMLANKSCERSTTWGPKFVTKWEEDHALIDEKTLVDMSERALCSSFVKD